MIFSLFVLHSSLIEFPLLYLNLSEGLDNVTFLNIIVVDEAQTTLHTGNYLLDIVLVTLQGTDFCSTDHDTVTDDASLILSMYLTLGNETTGDGAHLRNLEGLFVPQPDR